MSELPPGWALATLGDIVTEVRNGISAKPDRKAGLPILRISAVRPMRLDATDTRYLPQDFEGAEVYRLVQDDLLFTRYNGNRELVGVCARVRHAPQTMVYPDKLIRVRLNRAIAHPAFVEYAVHSSSARQFISEKLKTSAGQIGISGADLKRLPIPLAPLSEQKRIADKLDRLLVAVDTCKARLDAIPAILKRFRQSVLAAATSGELTEEWRAICGANSNWPTVSLESVALNFSYGTSAKSQSVGKVPVLRMGNIQDGKLVWDDLVYTSDASEIEKYRLTAGDVLFNRTNSPELVGKTAVFRGERDAICAGYLIRVQCGGDLLPDYLNYCLNSPRGREYCWRVKTDGVSQSNINARKLAEFSFSLPSLEEQREIVRRVNALDSVVESLQARALRGAEQVERLAAGLLGKAFRGDVVPPRPA